MENSVFAYTSYRPFLYDRLSAEGRRGQLTKAAGYLQCQTSFLSRVLNDELHITPDHAFKLAQFWGLSGDERTYFLKLVDYERAGDPEFRKFLKAQLDLLQKENSEISVRTQRKSKSTEQMSSRYFSSWIYGAVHFLTTISEFQTVSKLSKRLNIPESLVKETLEHLLEMGFVAKEKDKWIYHSGEFHLERTSPLVILHHQNWRQRAVLDAQNFDQTSIHYTTILTMSRRDAEKIRQKVLDFFAELNQIATPSDPEDEIIFTCDLFKV